MCGLILLFNLDILLTVLQHDFKIENAISPEFEHLTHLTAATLVDPLYLLTPRTTRKDSLSLEHLIIVRHCSMVLFLRLVSHLDVYRPQRFSEPPDPFPSSPSTLPCFPLSSSYFTAPFPPTRSRRHFLAFSAPPTPISCVASIRTGTFLRRVSFTFRLVPVATTHRPRLGFRVQPGLFEIRSQTVGKLPAHSKSISREPDTNQRFR